MTIWGLTLTTFYFGLVSIYPFINSSNYYKRSLLILFEVAFSLEYLITIIFWAYLFPFLNNLSTFSWFLQCNIHAIPFISLNLEFLFNNIKIYKEYLI